MSGPILEVAILQVKAGMNEQFEQSFRQASRIISGMNGYIGHELQKCIEKDNQYVLLVSWETLEDHTIGFRGSQQYDEWKSLLHRYYDPFPTVEHYTRIRL
ncbi:antibiotic biosynthesis monooxygenase [Paenibacillus hemerocallicola]|uniref:Antibiotic biosynthesis monooxygenase n=1 Tax=Paenibacillus hemerocallicola TaxID=1172614 RepID=A0A5C4TDZ5_9BACL|nr:antibiotic biosynthesis monooxygenase [Paenibacillus hemerocallicola]TNJ66669.1 antibiotic biosynthesis monooxygenase [Paenibacillus hemerocallicola]